MCRLGSEPAGSTSAWRHSLALGPHSASSGPCSWSFEFPKALATTSLLLPSSEPTLLRGQDQSEITPCPPFCYFLSLLFCSASKLSSSLAPGSLAPSSLPWHALLPTRAPFHGPSFIHNSVQRPLPWGSSPDDSPLTIILTPIFLGSVHAQVPFSVP